MNKFLRLLFLIFVITIVIVLLSIVKKQITQANNSRLDSLMISEMRKKSYPGSDIKFEQTLDPGTNYNRYIISYLSDSYKIFALMTVPSGEIPKEGFPVVIFNHGYIPPEVYQTTERYVAYVDAFARAGYIVLKSDYRGNGNSQGTPENPYYSPAYADDVLNAIVSIKKFRQANPYKIGIWGHSMGGNITLRTLVISKDIKAAVIWAGVVGSYDEIMNKWIRKVSSIPSLKEISNKDNLIKKYGTLQQNPGFWNSVDPTFFAADITVPVQLHHDIEDEEVPVSFSQSLDNKLKKAGKKSDLYLYPDGDHNIGEPNFDLAMQRSINFFDRYLK